MDFVLSGNRDNLQDKRQPDVAFVKKERLQKTPGYFYGAPDLAIEIVSPSQSRPDFVEKASVYLKYGTEQVWLVFPQKQQIEVHTAETIPNVYDKTEIVPGGDLLPGFELRVSQLFDT
jgi:Uma2 family endonuclease